MLVRRASYLAAGGFDDDYFAYLEDVDLGWRLWAGGERVRFARDAVVHHRSMATSDLLGRLQPRLPVRAQRLPHRLQELRGGPVGAGDAGDLADPDLPHPDAAGAEQPGDLDPHPRPLRRLDRQHRPRPRRAANAGGPDVIGGADRPGGSLGSATGGADPRARASPASPMSPPRSRRASAARPSAPFPPATSSPPSPAKWRELGTRRAAPPRRPPPRPPAPPLPGPPHGHRRAHRGAAPRPHLSSRPPRFRRRQARSRVQARRRVPDREIFARFPPYLVPTYPGDAHLFAGPGFRTWLPDDLPLVESTLEELMEIAGSGRRSAGPQT